MRKESVMTGTRLCRWFQHRGFSRRSAHNLCNMSRVRGRLHRNGFTLVELLVVIAIIAVLAAMMMPALAKSVDVATTAQCTSQLRQVYVAYFNYAEAYNGAVPNTGTGYNPNLVHMGQSTFIDSPSKYGNHHPPVFVCPVSRKTDYWKLKLMSDGTYSVPTYYPNPGLWNYTKRLDTPIAGTANNRRPPTRTPMLGELSVLAGSTGALYLFAWMPDRFGFNHLQGGVFNSLFFDGHTETFTLFRLTASRDWVGY